MVELYRIGWHRQSNSSRYGFGSRNSQIFYRSNVNRWRLLKCEIIIVRVASVSDSENPPLAHPSNQDPVDKVRPAFVNEFLLKITAHTQQQKVQKYGYSMIQFLMALLLICTWQGAVMGPYSSSFVVVSQILKFSRFEPNFFCQA